MDVLPAERSGYRSLHARASKIALTALAYTHVDVFAEGPYTGNSLPVFLGAGELASSQMLQITQELRHFEAIFVSPTDDPLSWRARVFDLFAELPFAGHPVIGAAAVLHRRHGISEPTTWRVELPSRSVAVETRPSRRGLFGSLDQGPPEYLGSFEIGEQVARIFELDATDIRDDLPLEVVSTGLRYLVVPVSEGALERARVTANLTELVESVGAEFAVLLDASRLEIRHWNNDGVIEDVATGSAAGVIGAYLLRHGIAVGGQEFLLHQGRHAGRPSVLRVRPEGTCDCVRTVHVGGGVAFVGRGLIKIPA